MFVKKVLLIIYSRFFVRCHSIYETAVTASVPLFSSFYTVAFFNSFDSCNGALRNACHVASKDTMEGT